MNITILLPGVGLLATAYLSLPLVGCDRQAAAPAAAVGPAANLPVEIVRLADGKGQGSNPVAQLGTLTMGQRRSDAFTLVNHADVALQLTSNASCGCTRVTFDKKSADPGERVGFTLSYNSAAKPENLGRVRQPFLLTLTPVADAADPAADAASEPIPDLRLCAVRRRAVAGNLRQHRPLRARRR